MSSPHLNKSVTGAAEYLRIADPVELEDRAVVALQLLHTAVIRQRPDLDDSVRTPCGQQPT